MTYQVELHKRVEKFLDTQSDNFVESFFEKASLIAQNPQDLSILDIKPLQ
jgi:mRNA-degrading endonuclease RelE of RelBE toxin-antitoxin system